MRHALSIVMLRAHTDQALVAMARDGNESAFTVLVERYRGSLLALARRLGDASRAEDAVQQGLMQAWAALRGGAVVNDTRPWLHQIVRHATYAPSMRARPEEELPETLAGSPEPHAAVERRMHLRSVTAAIQDLPDNQRSALLQTAIEGRSNRDVANDLGLSESAVRQLVHRARTRLRQAAAAISPLPGLSWIARRHASPAMSNVPAEGALPAAAAAGGGIIVKAAVVFLAAGALATGGVEAHRALEHPHPTPASVAQTRAAATASRPAVAGTQPAGSPGQPYDERAAAQLHRAGLSPGATSGPAGADPTSTDQATAPDGGGGSSNSAPPASTDPSSPTANDQPASSGGTDASQPPAVTGGTGTAFTPGDGSTTTATAEPRPGAIDPTTTDAPTADIPAVDAAAPEPDPSADTTDTP